MRLKLCFLLVFIVTFSWAQTTKTFNANGTFAVPAGVTSINAQAWGGGGSGGGASGAGLLLGRGAAGGGGGAYVSAALSVSSGQVLNVAVAGQTSGTSGGNGTSGGSSTITGFESSFLAAGGSGGGANNAGGTPLGGLGGSISSSAGTIKFAGLNGVQGNTWSLLSILLTSGAGGSGANFGGVGGAAVGSLILGTAPGNAGSAPGGGGSGAINSALGAAQVGGAGAAGQVIISYTCPTYNFTGTTASNVCLGASSTVTVSSGASSLPVGNYVVTYNVSSPSATALTANMTVSTAGTGSFTVSGLTNTGSSTITITKISSETCSSNITANNTATVIVSPATVGGTATGGTTINGGSTSGLLTLSGHTGSVIKWQSSVSPFIAWTDIANTTTTYTSGVLNKTTQFRAVVQSGACAVANSVATTVTVIVLPTINLTGAQAICAFNDGSTLQTSLGYFGTTGSPTTYSIVWNSSPANSFTPVTDAALPGSPITLFFPAATATGIYTGTLTVKNANGDVSPGSVFTVDIGRAPSITTTGIIDPLTTSSTAQNATLAYSATTDNPTSYSIDWYSAANAASLEDQFFSPFAFSPGGGVINTIEIAANVPAGTYSATMRIHGAGCTESLPISITINPALPTITLSPSAAAVCSRASEQNTTLSYSATTGSPITYSITWPDLDAQFFADVTDAILPSSPITIVIPAQTVGGTYIGLLTVKNANGVVSDNIYFDVIVNETPKLTSSGVLNTICSSTDSQNATLEYTAATGNPTKYSITWFSGLIPDQNGTDFVFNSNGGIINNIVIPANLPAGTYLGLLIAFSSSQCTQNLEIIIKINETPTITTDGIVVPVATSSSEQTTTLNYTAVTGNPTSYSIDWDSAANAASLADQFFTAFTSSPGGGVINTIEIPANVPVGTYSGVLRIVNEQGCAQFLPIAITISDPAPTIHLTSSDVKYCLDNYTYDHYKALPYDSTTGSPVTYSIAWDSSPTNSFSAVTDAALPANAIQVLIPLGTTSNTYTGTLTVKNSNGDVSSPVPFSIKVGRYFGITTTGSIAAVATSSSEQTTTLAYSAVTGNTSEYYIDWDAAANTALLADQGYTPFFSEPTGGEIDSIEIPANVPPGTYHGTIIFFDGSCGVPKSVTIVISNEAPTIDLAAKAENVCSDGNATTTTLSYSGTTGDPVTYSIAWAVFNNELEGVTDAVLTSSPITIAIPAGVPAGTYTGNLKVKNADGVVSNISQFTFDIGVPPEIDFDVLARSVCTSTSSQNTSLAYDLTAGNPTSFYIDWNQAANDALLTDQPDTPYAFELQVPTALDEIHVPANAQSGIYKGTLYIKDGACVLPFPITLIISQSSTAPIIDSIVKPTSTNPTGSVTLSGLPSSGNWSIESNPATTTTIGSGTSTTITGLQSGSYTFTVTSDATRCPSEPSAPANLTTLVFERMASNGSKATETKDLNSTENTILISSSNKVINVDTFNQIINKVYVFDVSGNLIYQKNGVSDSKLSIDNLRSSNQVLLVKVLLNNNKIETRKVVF